MNAAQADVAAAKANVTGQRGTADLFAGEWCQAASFLTVRPAIQLSHVLHSSNSLTKPVHKNRQQTILNAARSVLISTGHIKIVMASLLLFEATFMELRHHPLMCYRGIRSWPPIWFWRCGEEDQRPEGEVGILKGVLVSGVETFSRCYLIIEHEGAEYVGRLLFDDSAFCTEVYKLLLDHRGHSIKEIGGLEIKHGL